MGGAQEPPGGHLTDHISLGVLSAAFSRDLIEEVIGAAGKREKRSRLLPAHVMVRYVSHPGRTRISAARTAVSPVQPGPRLGAA